MRGFFVLGKLVLVQAARSWARTLLGLLGIAISVCLVIWIVRGYEAAASRAASSAATSESRFDVVITATPRMGSRPSRGVGRPPRRAPSTQPQSIDAKLISELRRDPAVAEVVAAVRSQVRIVAPAPKVQMGPFGGRGSLIGAADKTPLQPLDEGRWIDPAADGEAVISAGFGGRYGVKLGDSVTVGGGGERKLTVVGVLSAGGGGMLGQAGDLYVPMAAADYINGYSGRVNVVNVVLKDPQASDAFIKTWTEKLASAPSPLSFRSLRQQDDDPMGGRMIGMIKVQADNAKVLAFMAACFITFVTLSVGVRERAREHAMLRAIALSRWQLVLMIVVEGVLLAAVGWGIGVLFARGLLGVGTWLAAYLKFFQSGAFADYPLSVGSILTAAGCALAGALAAAILPAWQAIRLRPADVLGGSGEWQGRRFPRLLVAIGLVLVVLNPAAVLLANVEPVKTVLAKTYKMGFAPPLLSCGAMILGLAMVSPLAVRLADAVFGPLLSWLLRLDRRFLRQQLTANLWRSTGTTVAMSAGLGLFVTALVWGYSMLVPFTPDESLPRMLVSVLPAGVPEIAIDEVRHTPGVVSNQCLPLAVEQPRLTDEMLQSKPFASVDESQQHVLVMGLDPAEAFGGDDPVLRLKFVQGDRASAAEKLAGGRFCLVPEDFHTKTGLGVGDRFSVAVPNEPGKSIDYEIAGVVYVPGWHWFTKFSEIRRRSGRALAVIFADYNQVRADYRIGRISYFWMNADENVPFAEMVQRLTPLADKYANVRVDVPGAGETQVAKQYVKITERADLIGRLNRRADSVIWALTQFPLLVLVIASLGVFNAVFASVRARYWQFGVLRGVGLSRWQLFRLVISESLLLFLAAGSLSLVSGVLLAWCGTHICTYFFYFGGMTPPLVIPWKSLSLGFGIAFGLCLLAGILPAWQAARKEPLRFIQAGRLAAQG